MKKRPTQRAADGWVCTAFLGMFLALGWFRFEGDSTPTHPSLTQAVRRNAVFWNKARAYQEVLEVVCRQPRALSPFARNRSVCWFLESDFV